MRILRCNLRKLEQVIARLRAAIVAVVLAVSAPAWAQSLEPRSYANTPVGMNFFLLGYGYSTGGVGLDPAAPIQDGEVTSHTAVASYARAIGVAGKSAKILFVVPYGWMSGSATLAGSGERRSRDVAGFGDPLFRLSVNFLGAPALAGDQFRTYRQRTIVGASLQVTAPLGDYDGDKLLNLGTNRWSFRPEVGASKALGPWNLEAALAVTWFTANDDFFGGQVNEQDPLLSLQGHAIRSFRRGSWVAFDATHYTGGNTTVNGVSGDDRLSNWRYGATGAVPIDRRNSIKFYVSDGFAARRGADFTLVGAVWQYRWGGGLR